MTVKKSIIERIGLSNIITIVVLVVTLAVGFGGLFAKVDMISKSLDMEIQQRKEQDVVLKVQMEDRIDVIDKRWEKTDASLLTLNSSFNELNRTMMYHLGATYGGLPKTTAQK